MKLTILLPFVIAPLLSFPAGRSDETTYQQDQRLPTVIQPSADEDAQFHYKVALTALKNNDLDIAAKELEKAAQLAPSNALVQYYLAVVKSQNGRPAEALMNLKRAMNLGLPREQARAADDLLVRLTYESQKGGAGSLSWLIGFWIGEFTSYADYSGPTCFYRGGGKLGMTVREDADHPDLLSGLLVFSGGSYELSDGNTDRCERSNGEPTDLNGSAYFEITKIEERTDSDGKGRAVVYGLRKRCDGPIGFESGYHFSFCNPRFETFVISFSRIDESHIRASGWPPDLDVLTKQEYKKR